MSEKNQNMKTIETDNQTPYINSKILSLNCCTCNSPATKGLIPSSCNEPIPNFVIYP